MNRRMARPGARRVWTIFVTVVAVLYFLVDALFLAIVKPFAAQLLRLRIFDPILPWIAALGPYPTLILFLVPIAILEPCKPLGFYLMATHHLASGLVIIALAELVKVLLLERLFHMSRDKLLSIRWFATVYAFVVNWLERLKAHPAWQAAMARLARLKEKARRFWWTISGTVSTNAKPRPRNERGRDQPRENELF